MVDDGDSWEAPHSGRARAPWAVVGLLVLAGVVGAAVLLGGQAPESLTVEDHDGDDQVEDGQPEDVEDGDWPRTLPSAAEIAGEWSSMPGPAPAVTEPLGVVWTGRELLAVGASGQDPVAAALDPSTGAWRQLSGSPLSARSRAAVAWMPAADALSPGSGELFVWGGYAAQGEWWHDGGARYDPEDDRWTGVADGPLPPAADAFAVWDGAAVLVGGGRAGDRHNGRVARYDPDADRWEELPTPFGEDTQIAGLVQPGSTAIAVSATGDVVELRRNDTWHPLPPVPRRGGTLAAVVGFGVHAAVWEVAADPDVPGRLHVLDVASARWTLAPPAPIGKSETPRLVALSDVDVALLGTEPADGPGEGRLAGAIYTHRGVDRWQALPPTGAVVSGDSLVAAAWSGHDLLLVARDRVHIWRPEGQSPPLEARTDALVHLAADGQMVTVDVDARRVSLRDLPAGTWPVGAVGDWLLMDGGEEPYLVHASGGAITGLGGDASVLAGGAGTVWVFPHDGSAPRVVAVEGDEVGAPEQLAHPLPAGWWPALALADALVLVDEEGGWMLWDPRAGAVLREGRGERPMAAGEQTLALCELGSGSAACPALLLVTGEPEADRRVRLDADVGGGWVFAPGDTHLAITYLTGGLPRGLGIIDVADPTSERRVPLPTGWLQLAWHHDGGILFAAYSGVPGDWLFAVRAAGGDPGPYVVPVEIPERARIAVTRNP